MEEMFSSPERKSTYHKKNGSSVKKYRTAGGDTLNIPGYSSDSQFACRHCGKRYRWKSTMRRHEQVECGGKEPSFQCPHCPYKAKQKGNLGVHIRKHHQIILEPDVMIIKIEWEWLPLGSLEYKRLCFHILIYICFRFSFVLYYRFLFGGVCGV